MLEKLQEEAAQRAFVNIAYNYNDYSVDAEETYGALETSEINEKHWRHEISEWNRRKQEPKKEPIFNRERVALAHDKSPYNIASSRK